MVFHIFAPSSGSVVSWNKRLKGMILNNITWPYFLEFAIWKDMLYANNKIVFLQKNHDVIVTFYVRYRIHNLLCLKILF